MSAALAQGAGDQQYQDPFAGSDSGSGSSGSKDSGGSKTKTGSDGSIEPLSPSPQNAGGSSSGSSSSGSGSSAGTATPAAPAPSTSPQATGSLPNTGLDTRVVLLAGAVLLLAGLGLRLRSAPERF
ncbi:MAG TPA: LPXTG cell wall anchor domain-containing protein [Baekduia sp.]